MEMNKASITGLIRKKKSYLCIGLDTDITKIPDHLLEKEDPVFEFNKAIIEATADICIAYKPNLAFYESLGYKGWRSLERTMEIIPGDCFTIADAKRGDIGNTSTLYARAFFQQMNFDSVTVAPYMGEDSVKPFLAFRDKWVILLALTSNSGAMDFQMNQQEMGGLLFEEVMRKAMTWGTPENLMFVCGATRAEQFGQLREIAPDHFFLVPGVGAQGGDLSEISRRGFNKDVGLIVNSSRQIIYAGQGEDFASLARAEAQKIQQQMEALLHEFNLM